MFWVISVYCNIRNSLLKSGTFLLGHPVYVCVCVCVCVCVSERERERERERKLAKPMTLYAYLQKMQNGGFVTIFHIFFLSLVLKRGYISLCVYINLDMY